jgi:thioredoxin 1
MAFHPKTEEEYYYYKNNFDGLVVVDFSASWCGPCKRIEPVLDILAGKYTKVLILHIDIEKFSDLKDVEDVNRLPTFKFYKDGKYITKFSGANENLLEEHIVKHR